MRRPSRIAPSTADRLEREPRGSGRAGGSDATDAGKAGRRRERRAPRERPPRLGDQPVDIDSLEGGFLRRVSHVPGGIQVIMTVGLAIVVAVITGMSKLYKDPGFETDRDAPFTMTIFEKLGTPLGALVISIPLVATFVALAFSLHPQRRRIWIGSSVVIFVAMLFNIVLMNFLVVGGFLIYAAWRSRRIEDPPPPRVRRGAARAAADDDEVDEDGDDGGADEDLESGGADIDGDGEGGADGG